MARSNILSAIEQGLAEGRQIAAERAKLEQEQRQMELAQSNSDRQFGLGVFNAMLQMQSQAPKPADPNIAAGRDMLGALRTAYGDEYLTGVAMNRYTDPPLLAQIIQGATAADDKGLLKLVDLPGTRTESANLQAQYNTAKLNLGVSDGEISSLMQALATGADIGKWTEERNAAVQDGVPKLTHAAALQLAALSTRVNAGDIELYRELDFDNLMRTPDVAEAISVGDKALSAIGRRAKDSDLSDVTQNLTSVIQSLESAGFRNTARGRAILERFEKGITQGRSMTAQTPDETNAETITNQLALIRVASNAAMSGRADDAQWEILRGSGLSEEDFAIARALATAGDDAESILDADPVGASEVMRRIALAEGRSVADASTIAQRVSMGYPIGPNSADEVKTANTALGTAQTQLATAASDPYADTQPQEVNVIVQKGRALKISRDERDTQLRDFLKQRKKADPLTQAGLAVIKSVAGETQMPVRLTAEATASYLLGKGDDVDEVVDALKSEYKIFDEDARKIVTEVSGWVGKK